MVLLLLVRIMYIKKIYYYMKNLVLITSIIKTPDTPLSYINTRSVYSHDERFEQTKKTIQTIREKIPDSIIFIVECSDLDEVQHKYMTLNCDYFLNLYNSNFANNMFSHSKSLCEGTMTYCALEYILTNNIEFNNLIKISGRYWLSNNFNYSNFDNNDIIVKFIENNKDNIFTALYKLPKKEVLFFKLFLENNFNHMENCIGYEVLFALFINTLNNNIQNIEQIGLDGYVSVSGDYYSG